MCCTVSFGRSLGMALLPLSLICMMANMLLMFPMGERSYMQQDRLASYVWFFGGLGGGGLMMLIPVLSFISLGKWNCCWKENLVMCGSVLAAVVGLVGSIYCFVITWFTLMQGPQCFTSYGWSYPFADQRGRYLLQPELWSQCRQPIHIVAWNTTLLFVLLIMPILEFIICFLQLVNGLVNAVFRPCCYKQEYSLNA